ncbi:Protein of unknown function [Gryllus bimaculatus]|nr:Protein of unknown function [Gryllus bimaculatus]
MSRELPNVVDTKRRGGGAGVGPGGGGGGAGPQRPGGLPSPAAQRARGPAPSLRQAALRLPAGDRGAARARPRLRQGAAGARQAERERDHRQTDRLTDRREREENHEIYDV